MTCQTYHTVTDGTETLAQCDQCQERHYFKSLYFAKNWANAHAYNDPHLIRNALKYAIA